MTRTRRPQPETLDDLILAAGMPLHDLADRSHVSVRTIHSLRHGRVGRPHVRTIAALAAVLRVTPQRLRDAIEESARLCGA